MVSNTRKTNWQEIKPTVCGWGIVDVNYKVQLKEELPTVAGERKRKTLWTCPYYKDWVEMIRRSYSKKDQIKHPTYAGCTVQKEWQYLSIFIEWVNLQPNEDWRNCHLDKDILAGDSKVYSGKSCAYVSQLLNKFVNSKESQRGVRMIGVSINPKSMANHYIASCRDPFENKSKYVGSYPTELEAHKAWQAKKHEYACQLAELQADPRVAQALRERYAPDKDWTDK
jgi:hypothetical protein